MVIVVAMINGIINHLDQVSYHSIFFHFNGSHLIFSPHFFSIKGRYIETRVYTSDRLSGRVYDLIYMGKENLSRVYEALYENFISLSHI
jgi:hypothetical protein